MKKSALVHAVESSVHPVQNPRVLTWKSLQKVRDKISMFFHMFCCFVEKNFQTPKSCFSKKNPNSNRSDSKIKKKCVRLEKKLPIYFPFSNSSGNLLPGKLTYPLKINGWKMYFLLKQSLFSGHVSFRGCTRFRWTCRDPSPCGKMLLHLISWVQGLGHR